MTSTRTVLRVLIADDEPPSRRALRRVLERYSDIVVVAEASDGAKAVEAIRTATPDIVFLDIRMPEMDGIEVAETLSGAGSPHVIFVTAFDEYAVRAFEVEAVDYVLKPLDPDRIDQALSRARLAVEMDGRARASARIESVLEAVAAKGSVVRFPVREHGRISFVRSDEIDYVEAAADYVRLHSGTGSHLVRMTMGQVEQRLGNAGFVRIHRSYIVNVDRVVELHPHFNGEYHVVIADGSTVKSSRTYRENMRRVFGDEL